MTCRTSHYIGCECHEAEWAKKLEAAEARVDELEEALRHNREAQDVYTSLSTRIAQLEVLVETQCEHLDGRLERIGAYLTRIGAEASSVPGSPRTERQRPLGGL